MEEETPWQREANPPPPRAPVLILGHQRFNLGHPLIGKLVSIYKE